MGLRRLRQSLPMASHLCTFRRIYHGMRLYESWQLLHPAYTQPSNLSCQFTHALTLRLFAVPPITWASLPLRPLYTLRVSTALRKITPFTSFLMAPLADVPSALCPRNCPPVFARNQCLNLCHPPTFLLHILTTFAPPLTAFPPR